MIPIISLVGRKNSGKTTLLLKLIPLLEESEIRVACVKQHKHDVPVDVVGKDSWMYAQAGASCSIMSTSTQLSLVHQRRQMATLYELAAMAEKSSCNILIGESFNSVGTHDNVSRFVVARKDRQEEPRFSPEESCGIITDDSSLAEKWTSAGKLAFGLNDPRSFASYLCKRCHTL
ncbi:MAG: molybdopterin-guanine dinucleotide biosynthesis protein B [Coriobacteriia bacterium]|nr:molybdopterin-guanine dinucleotide biosynthesis protein B [Coriobacteriia bacterium]MCL2746008.1 molybdopterin-guanine dinucleotide biosynthesis protein B [Coriobacteriia bacterium]MCL2870711.1 molybdopterin-guanine dinucleotide biosynthesis protein B [Coriobacteriia bacterium]